MGPVRRPSSFILGLSAVACFLCSAVGAQTPAKVPTLDDALQLAAGGRLDESERMFLTLENASPQDPEIQYRFGLVLLKRGKVTQARRRLEAAAKLAPQPLVWLALAQARLRLDDLAAAQAALEHARSGNPAPPPQAFQLFDAEVIKHHLRKGQAGPAADLARKALTANGLPVFHHLLGQAHDLNHDPAAASDEFQQAIRLDTGQPAYYLDLAQLFLDHDTPEPAELVLTAAAQRFPANAELLRLLGLARYALGKNEEALDAFLQAIDAGPDLESAFASLETLLPSAGARLPEIRDKLRRFSQKRPSSPLGPYLLALTEAEGSEALLRRAIRAAPDFWPAHYELHKRLKAQDQWEAAAAALKKTIALKPDFAPAHYALAEYYNHIGDRARAAQEREIHRKLLAGERAAAEKRRAEAPRLSYQLSER